MTILQAFAAPLLAVSLISPPSFDQGTVYRGHPVSQPATADAWGQQTSDFSLGLVVPATATLGQAVPITLQLRNDHATNAAVIRFAGPQFFKWQIRSESGVAPVATPDWLDFPGGGNFEPGGDVVEPGKVAITNVRLDRIAKFESPGRYTVKVWARLYPGDARANKNSGQFVEVESNTATITFTR
jgi:hypothetical protein